MSTVDSVVESPIDWDECLRIANNKDKNAIELLSLFIKELPQSKEKINHAYEQNETESLHKELHKLLGSSCYSGVPRLRECLEEMMDSLLKDQVKLGKKQDDLLNKFNQLSHDIVKCYMEKAFYTKNN